MKEEGLFAKAERLWRESTHDEIDEKDRARRDFKARCGHLVRKGERVDLWAVLPEHGDAWLEPFCVNCSKRCERLGEQYGPPDPK